MVKFLVDRKGPVQFLQFVEESQNTGFDVALKKHYGIEGIDAFESDSLTQLKTPGQPLWDAQASSVAEEVPGGPSLN